MQVVKFGLVVARGADATERMVGLFVCDGGCEAVAAIDVKIN